VKQQYERAIPMVQLVAKRGKVTPAHPNPNPNPNESRSEINHDEEFDDEDLHPGRPVSPRRSNDYASRGLDPGPSSFSPTSLAFPHGSSSQARAVERGAMSEYDSDDTLAGTFESGRPMR